MSDPAHPRRAIARLARVALCAGALVVTAADPPADGPPAASSREAYRDLQLSVHARRSLHDDAALSELNIGVHVRDGVATLWGPVPAADLIPKAVKRVEAVQGIFSVKNELYVVTPEKKIDLFPLIPEEPLLQESAFPNSVSGSVEPLTGRDEKSRVVYPAVSPRKQEQAVELGRPIAVTAPTNQTTPPAVTTPKEPAATPPPRQGNLTDAVQRVRGGDPRFRTLRAEVRGGTVIISGDEERADAVMAMAQVVSRLPGVERVVTKSAP